MADKIATAKGCIGHFYMNECKIVVTLLCHVVLLWNCFVVVQKDIVFEQSYWSDLLVVNCNSRPSQENLHGPSKTYLFIWWILTEKQRPTDHPRNLHKQCRLSMNKERPEKWESEPLIVDWLPDLLANSNVYLNLVMRAKWSSWDNHFPTSYSVHVLSKLDNKLIDLVPDEQLEEEVQQADQIKEWISLAIISLEDKLESLSLRKAPWGTTSPFYLSETSEDDRRSPHTCVLPFLKLHSQRLQHLLLIRIPPPTDVVI